MSDTIDDLSWMTTGLEPGVQTDLARMDWSTLLTDGAPILLDRSDPEPIPVPDLTNSPQLQSLFTPDQLANLATLRDVNGDVVVPGTSGPILLGQGHELSFDDNTLQGRITPALLSKGLDALAQSDDGGLISYTGSDLRVLIEVEMPPDLAGDARPRYAKQLLECTTLSVSIHREKAPVRAAGYIGPKGFARGKRTVAGTMIMTQFTVEVLAKFMQSVLYRDLSLDTHYKKVDQLPPFNMSLLFTNESGFASYRRLLGVEFLTDGTTYSVQDLYTEQAVSYMAADFTPLLPLNVSSLFKPVLRNRDTRKVPADRMRKPPLIGV